MANPLVRRRILVVGDEGVVLFNVTGKGVQRECSLPWTVPNFEEQLVNVLESQNQRKPVLILVDAVDQHYRKEKLPANVGSFDRGKVVSRKLDMAFSNYPIKASLELKGKQKSKKRSKDKTPPVYLFVGLPESDMLGTVSYILEDSQVPIAGLALLPVESTNMVDGLNEALTAKGAKRSRWSVLIGHHETGGLRQIVVKDGDLALTRLTPTPEGGQSGGPWAAEVEREFKATLSYIARFGYNAEDGLDLIVLCDEQEGQMLSQANLPVTKFRALGLQDAAELLKIKLGPAGLEKTNYVEALHAAWVGKKFKPSLLLKNPELQKIHMPRMAARAASLLLIVSALTLSVMDVRTALIYKEIGEEIEGKQAQRNLLSKEYEQEAVIFDSLPFKPEVVQGTLAVKELLHKNSLSPNPYLSRIKQVLGPGTVVETFSMAHKPHSTLPVGQNTGGRRRGRAARTAQNQGDRGTIDINFEFGLPDLGLEERVNEAEIILSNLQAMFPDQTVSITRQFGDVSRTGAFKGEAGVKDDSGRSSGVDEDLAAFKIEGVPL